MAQRRLILFDVDGTLIAPGPAGRHALAAAISDYLGQRVRLSFHDVAGFTDPIIIRTALTRHSHNNQLPPGSLDTILKRYLATLEEQLGHSKGVKVFPGAAELVRACKEEHWVTALLTGNVERGARAKLAGTGLWDQFEFGIFGGDANAREDLPWMARERAWDALHEVFHPADMILVGDTPNDARVARLNGVASLIVCRRQEPEWRQAIQAERPTWLVDNFDNVPGLIQLMRGGAI